LPSLESFYATFSYMLSYINNIIRYSFQFFYLMREEHPLLAEKPVLVQPCLDQSHGQEKTDSDVVLSKTTTSDKSHDFCNHSESFKKLVEMGLPCNESVVEKLRWLRSQIIGYHAEFDSPFGKRKVLYADHTASGRSLHYNENFIINHVLPFYGMILTSFHQTTLIHIYISSDCYKSK